jgi:4a-hydroxytetrahydrobiopterin dehydratase
MPAPKLSEADIAERLTFTPEWKHVGDKIQRTIKCESFNAAIALINRIAPLADEADHHPEIFNVYDRVELALTTHDTGGLTRKDFDLAAKIDAVA